MTDLLWLRRSASGMALLVLMAAVATAQTIEVRPLLRVGDDFRLEFTRTREDSSRPGGNTRAMTAVEVRVVRADADGITLEWESAEDAAALREAIGDPLVKAIADAGKGLRLRLALSPEGEVKDLLNRAEVLPRLQQMVDVILDHLLPTVPIEQRAKVEEMLDRMLSPALLVSAAMQQAATYFSLHGGAFPADRPLETALEQPNPLGGEPVPATLRVAVETAAADRAVMTTTVKYEGASLLKTLQTLAQQAGAPPMTDAQVASLEFTAIDEGRFVLDRSLGLMREVSVNRRIRAGPQTRVDRTEIKLVRPPKR